MPYTIHDTPEVVERIEQDLDTVTETVAREDPALRSLVLTGAFARGEGAVLDGAPQNDYDLVAIRGLGRARTSYEEMAGALEQRLGLHIDLAPVHAWRLPLADRSIFWYETSLRGQVLWGEDLLGRIPVQSADDLDPLEGLRLLTNRAAGLLLATGIQDAHERRLQAAKALLAAADARLLAAGRFPPSQRERWAVLSALRANDPAPQADARRASWTTWAYLFKVDPGATGPVEPQQAWQAAAASLLDAVPVALKHAGLPSLDAYARADGLVDHLVFAVRARQVPGASALTVHPTGRVRVATLRLLQASRDGHVHPDDARQHLGSLAEVGEDPLGTLEALRAATLQ